MGDFAENLKSDLLNLTMAQDHIMGVRNTLIPQNTARAHEACRTMAEAFNSLGRQPEKQLAVFYVFNDIVQTAKKLGAPHNPAWPGAGYEVLLPAIANSAARMPDDKRQKLFRVLEVWQQREIYSAQAVQTMHNALLKAVQNVQQQQAEHPCLKVLHCLAQVHSATPAHQQALDATFWGEALSSGHAAALAALDNAPADQLVASREAYRTAQDMLDRECRYVGDAALHTAAWLEENMRALEELRRDMKRVPPGTS